MLAALGLWGGVFHAGGSAPRLGVTSKRSIHSGAHNDGYCESVVSLQLRGDKRWRMLGTEGSGVLRSVFGPLLPPMVPGILPQATQS